MGCASVRAAPADGERAAIAALAPFNDGSDPACQAHLLVPAVAAKLP